MQLTERSIESPEEVAEKINLEAINYGKVNQLIELYKQSGIHFLKENLNDTNLLA